MGKIYFTKDTIKFFEDLSKNNTKEWFAENRYRYDNYVVKPAKEFVVDMGEALKDIIPNISYAPKIDGSIFRIHKDARINKGKAPFKTHLGIIFWEGLSRLDSSCFYIHIEPPFYYTGVGTARFSPELLKTYRETLSIKKEVDELEKIKKMADKNYYEFKGEKLKNIPKGFTPINDTAEYFLKYKSLYLADEMPINKEFYTEDLFNNTLEIFKNMAPYHNWLTKLINKCNMDKIKE